MSKPAHRLEQDLVRAAFDFYAKRPWKTIDSDALFLVRVPGEESPLVASVMGSGGDEYGLVLARGDNALTQLAGVVLGTSEAEEFGRLSDVLSISFDTWGMVSDDFRRLLQKAGQQPRRERMVPVIFHSPPHRVPHPPGRDDMRTLLVILRGINAALDEGTFRPLPLDPRSQRLIELTIEPQGKRVSHTTREVDWPKSSLEVPPLLMLPGDLKDLPPLQENWLVARLTLPVQLEDEDDELTSALLLGVEGGRLRDVRMSRGADLTEAAALLTDAMRGQGATETEAGLPRAILFHEHWLHGSLAPALASLGIETAVDPESEAMEAMLDAVADALPSEQLELEPDSLEFWKDAEYRTGELLAEEINRKELITTRAMTRHFGDADSGEAVLETYGHFSAHTALIEWLAADYRATRRSKTLIEKLLAKKRDIDPQVRQLLEARQSARPSVYHVLSCEPGLSFEVEDIFDGEHFTIHDKSLSGCDLEGVFLPMRLICAGEWTFALIAGPPLTSMQVTPAIHAVARPDADLDHVVFSREPEILSSLWTWLLHQRPPIMQNTDGEALENQSATFLVTNADELLSSFNDNPDLDFDERKGTWVWGRESGSAVLGSRTVLGRLTLIDDRLLLEVNSAERLERARAWLEKTGALRFESATSSAFLSDDGPLDDRLPASPAEAAAPAMIEALKSMMLEHYKRWADEPIPLLDNLTPRQACKTARGKRRVEQMIRTMPAVPTPDGPIEPPRAEILADLGIRATDT